MQQTVPLNKLVLSPRNVRKTNGDEDIAGLADSIASKGLLQNLVVSPAESGKGVFEVDAGGRRWRALQLLADRKDLPKNWPVPVYVIGRENATEASLAENLQKIAMNPADEVEAFAAIMQSYSDNGMSNELERVANCARRFGQTERYVRQRLALAALAPEILDALREARITIAAATAYASHPNQAEQLKVFKAHEKKVGTYGKHDPREIRDALKGRLYALDHKLVRYVGLDAYRAAGGATALDLFFEEDDREVLLDTGLLEKLATEKGALEAQQLAQADGWLDGLLQPVAGQSWATPPEPKGFAARWGEPATMAAEDRADNIAIYRIGEDGQVAIHSNYYFLKLAPVDPSKAAARQQETEEQRAERRKQFAIRNKAFRLAAPQAAGTPFEGKLFWPPIDDWYEDFEEDDDDETMLVGTIQIRIAKADLEAQLAEAERRYELEQQELREEEEALAAEGDGPDDGEADEEPEQDPDINDAASADVDAEPAAA